MGFIKRFPPNAPFLPIQFEGLWGGSALMKHNRYLATVDLRASGSKSFTKPDTKIENAVNSEKGITGLELS